MTTSWEPAHGSHCVDLGICRTVTVVAAIEGVTQRLKHGE